MIVKILSTFLLVISFSLSGLAQSVGGGGSGGGGLRVRVSHAKCVEGSRRIFYERQLGEDHTVTVVRTCQNGSYYDLSDYVYNPKNRCKEGRLELWTERDHINDQTIQKRVRCTNGKWKVIDLL